MRIITLLLILFAPNMVQAQTVPPLTAEDAVALVIKNNPRLSAVLRDANAARSGVRSARALVNPTFTLSPAVPNSNGSSDAVLFTQPLELNGTRSARTGIASAQLRATQAKALTELRELVFEVKTAYYEVIRERELLALAQGLLKMTEELDALTRRQVELGKRPGIDTAQTEIEVFRAQQQATQAEGRVKNTVIALNTLLNRKPDTPFGALSSLPPPMPENPDRDFLVRQALVARAEVALEDAVRDSFLQEARMARAEGRPDIAPMFRSNELVRAVTPQDYGFGITITLPLLDWGSRRNRIRQAEESANAQNDRLSAIRSQIRQEVERSLTRLRTADTLLKSYRQGVLERAKRLLEASRTGLQEGQLSILSVLEAQRTYRTVQIEYVNAQAEYAQAVVELERTLGTVPATLLPTFSQEVRRSK